MAAGVVTADFLGRLLAIEDAWALLDGDASRDRIDAAIALGGHSSQVAVRAAELLNRLGDHGAALRALEAALAHGGPNAPLQIALAGQHRNAGDFDATARWLRGAMLRARPGARIMADLAAVELEAGHAECAEALIAVLGRFRADDGPGLAEAGRRLLALGRPDLALGPFRMAHGCGLRDPDFINALGDLLRTDGVPAVDPQFARAISVHVALLKLSAAWRDHPVLSMVRSRAAGETWLDTDAVARRLREAIRLRRPFSWIRLGDGEGRLLVHVHARLRGDLDNAEARMLGDHIWSNWFGPDLRAPDPDRLTVLTDQLDAAIAGADLLGLCSAARINGERELLGPLAAIESHVAGIAPGGSQAICDAYASLTLNECDPFYASLLSGLDFLGVISPHVELTGRLGARLGIARTASYIIPGESRLAARDDGAAPGAHYPDRFDRLMNEIEVPFEGAVFLVAGGLLGKIYCHRIRQLGGIALDVGSVVDAWMGHNTRGFVLDRSMRHQLV